MELELQRLGFRSWCVWGLVRARKSHQRARTLAARRLLTCPVAVPHALRRYDNKASDLTKAGMEDGVSKTGCFLLFLSAGVMRRPYVQVAYRGSFVARALHCVAI